MAFHHPQRDSQEAVQMDLTEGAYRRVATRTSRIRTLRGQTLNGLYCFYDPPGEIHCR